MQNFEFRKLAGIEALVCLPFEQMGFVSAFSTRSGGVSPLPQGALNLGNPAQDSRENIVENRRRFLSSLGVSDWPLFTAHQIHSTKVLVVGERDEAGAEPGDFDALTTSTRHRLLGILTADCAPILLADKRLGAIAAVHAGWRGTLNGIVARTIETMQHEFGVRPVDLIAALGPSIGPCCLEVGPEVIDSFRRTRENTDLLVSNQQPNGKGFLDINLSNRFQLEAAGVPEDSIYDCKLCTVCHNHHFFSYRRETGSSKPVGRLMGIIGRE